MSNLLALRNGVVNAMRALTGANERFEGVTISPHGGDFDTKRELEAYAKRAPHIVISPLRVQATEHGGQPFADIMLGAFCLTIDKPLNAAVLVHRQGRKEDSALALADNVIDFVRRFPTKDMGASAGRVKNVHARNLYSETWDERGVHLWGVFWEQTVELAPPIDPDYPGFRDLYIDWDIYPRDNEAELGDVVDAQDRVEIDPFDDGVLADGDEEIVAGDEDGPLVTGEDP